jgi:hypothetical protein
MAAVLLSASAKPASISKSFHFSRLDTPLFISHGLKFGFAKKKTVFSEKTTFTISEHHAGAGWQSEEKCTEQSSVNYKMIEVFKNKADSPKSLNY